MTEKPECFQTLGVDITLTDYSECYNSMNRQDCYSTNCLADKQVRDAPPSEKEVEEIQRDDTKEATSK